MTDSMSELEAVLTAHAKRYSRMQPSDAVKLVYQNEFGGGHLIRDEKSCLDYLRLEYASVEKEPAAPLHEDIGNGIVRVHLAAVKPEELEQLGRDFLDSAARHKGSMASFRDKLERLRLLAEKGIFSFGPEALNTYLSEYAQAGFPAVSHSPEFREAYHPAYRIILRSIR